MVHGVLLLFTVKEWEGPQTGAPGQEMDGDVWLIMRVLCLIDLLCFFCGSQAGWSLETIRDSHHATHWPRSLLSGGRESQKFA